MNYIGIVIAAVVAFALVVRSLPANIRWPWSK